MAELKRTSPSETLQWAKEKKRRATILMQHTSEISQSLFLSDDIAPFLNLLARLHHFDIRNLLLIYERFPEASCLAGYKLWEKMIQPKGAQVLRKEWVGKGIDLLAPFTDSLDGKHLLVWYYVTMYDIGQTNVEYTPPAPVYSDDPKHRTLILSAVQRLLSDAFGRSVVLVAPTRTMRAAGIPGLVVDGKASIIQLRSDISETEQLRWLSEILIRLFLYEIKAPSDSEQFLTKCISHCLSRIWLLPELAQDQIKPVAASSEDTQLMLLTYIHRVVRCLEDSVSRFYCAFREDDAEHSVDFTI